MQPSAMRGANDVIPVARPANPDLAVVATADEEIPEEPWLTRVIMRGWASSITVHSLLLLGMALWYFTPKSTAPRAFDTRLAGSDMGVEEGLSARGGLNTPIELAAAPTPAPEPMPSTLQPLSLENLDAKLSSLSGAEKPSGGGGVDNPNPGAGNGDGFGLARFGEGGENIRGVQVKVGDPQFTLLWDTEVDLDLHVIEPSGKEIYWEHPNGTQGGELDVDNTKGFGPENIYWLRESETGGEKVKGPGPAGEYRWYVVYWGGFGGVPKPTKWKVRIKHDGKVTVVQGRLKGLNEKSKVHSLKVERPGEAGVAAAK